MPKKDCSELAQAILELAMNIATDPDIKNIDEVVAEIQKSFPQLHTEAIIDAIVDASTNEAREIDELARKLARIKREAKTNAALREKVEEVEAYLEEGKKPEPPTPRKLSAPSIEQLRATSKNLRKWLATADPQMRENLENRLDELDKKIESGDIEMDRIREARLHDTLRGLQEQIKVAQQTIRDARAIKKVTDQIAAIERHLAEGTLPSKQARKKAGYGPLAVLREIRDDLKKQLSRSEPAQKQKLQADIKTLEDRIKKGDFAPRTRQVEIPQSKELQELIYQRDRLRRDIRVATMELKPKTIWYHIAEPFNAIRALMTSFDFSAVLRQGGFIAFAHPVRAAMAIPEMLKAFASEKESLRINNEILNRANAPLYARSKLYIAPTDGTERLHRLEEAYMTHWLERAAQSGIPIISQIAKVAEASERAYLTFLNKLRADSFDTMAATLAKGGEPTIEEARAIANFINEATGRGSVGLENAMVGLNTVFFAPKYVISRFQLLLGHPLWRSPNSARKLIAEEYARYLAGLIVVWMLGKAAGADVELDPRSSDFGKLRFGNTRLDPMSGLSQTAVITSRVILGKRKNAKGELVPIRGEDVPYGGVRTWGTISQFMRYKLSPTISKPLELLTSENALGQPVTKLESLRTSVTPLAFEDIFKAMQDQGIPKGAALSVLSIFGASLQSYEEYSNKSKRREE